MDFFISKKLFIYSCIILIGNCVLGYTLYQSKQNVTESQKWIDHTQQVIYQSVSVYANGNEIKTVSRDFILTNDSTYLKTMHLLAINVFAGIAELKHLTRDNPAQQKRIDSLNKYMHMRVDFALKATAINKEYGLVKAITYTNANNESYYSVPIQQLTTAIEQAERGLLVQRNKFKKASLAAVDRLSIFVFSLMTCFVIFILFSTRRYLIKNKEQQVSAAELIIANVELSHQNDEKEKRQEELAIANIELSYQRGEKKKRAGELVIANKELSYQSDEKEKRADELLIANKELSYQNDEKEKRAAELMIADVELSYQSDEKEKRAAELAVANIELKFQNNEKEKRAAELIIANEELLYQNDEKEKRAAELAIANIELVFQNDEKEKRADELLIANEELIYQNDEKGKRAAELLIANDELLYQNDEKGKRAAELVIANKELSYQNDEKEKRAAELVVANEELVYQNDEKEKRAAELVIANDELVYQNDEKEKRAAELAVANEELVYQNEEKGKRAAELVIANDELIYQNGEKEKRAAELVIANEELVYQNGEKEKRAAELVVANVELWYQNKEKEKRAAELVIANEELWYQNEEKEKRAAELVIANKELYFQNTEKEQRAIELAFANEELVFQNDVRKIAERNLVQSESRLKEAQAIAKTGNYEVDVVKHTEVWSEEMYKIYGIEKATVSPSKDLFFSFIHPDDVDDVKEAMDKASKSFNSFAADFRFIRGNGEVRYGHTEARSDRDSKKKLIRIYGIVQDVTETRLADIERKNIMSELTGRNNDLEQFAYIISHNLRAPVANIIGASSALNDEDATEEDKLFLRKAINISVIKLDDVVKDLNQILQVKDSSHETREVVDFSELLSDIKVVIENLIKCTVDITYDFSQFDKLITIKAYLYSIFYNLISNSVKYCKPDIPCSIHIESKLIKNTLQLTFTDNGMGINLEKNKDHIFGLYKRFHQGIEGKGMGLFMVKTQVEALGGKISIKSKENKGATFTIEFPV